MGGDTQRDRQVRQFELHVEDERSSDLRLDMVVVSDVFRAVQLADKLLNASSHHRGVLVYESGQRIFGLGSCATRPDLRL